MHLGSFQKFWKTAGFVLLLVIILLVTVYLGKNASSYMARASNCGVEGAKAVQLTSNSAVINWTTSDSSQGKIEYGTDDENLVFSQIEAEAGTTHNVPVTLLTPNTTYYYLINIRGNKCDSTGNKCDKNCVPWTFTTAGITPQAELERPLTTPSASSSGIPTVPVVSGSVRPSVAASPSGSLRTSPTVQAAFPTLSPFCGQLRTNIGVTNKAPNWTNVRKYDLDNNNVINAKDMTLCQRNRR